MLLTMAAMSMNGLKLEPAWSLVYREVNGHFALVVSVVGVPLPAPLPRCPLVLSMATSGCRAQVVARAETEASAARRRRSACRAREVCRRMQAALRMVSPSKPFWEERLYVVGEVGYEPVVSSSPSEPGLRVSSRWWPRCTVLRDVAHLEHVAQTLLRRSTQAPGPRTGRSRGRVGDAHAAAASAV